MQHNPLPAGHWARRFMQRLPWRIAGRVAPFVPKGRRRRVRVSNDDLIGSRALIDDFITAITSGREPAVSGREGLRDVKVVLAAYQAMQTGAAVLIDQS
jgi:predicted dehydrogenase